MNLIDEAESLMLYQFRDATKLKSLLHSLINPLQSIADNIDHFSDGFHIGELAGHWLDVLGGMVGQSRIDMSDEDFRTWIKIRIKLNRCHGTPDELLSILKLLIGNDYPLTLAEHKPKDVVFIFLAPLKIPPRLVFSLIKVATPMCLKHHFINATIEKPFTLGVSSFAASRFADFFEEGFSYGRI
jgi:hypothetical protein